MTRLIFPVIGVGLLVASGVLYAMQTGHTRDPRVMAEAARRVDAARDISVEGWSSERVDIEAKQLNAAEAAGGGSVRYVPEASGGIVGEAVNVMLLCGPHGPISVHPPTACFRGIGYHQVRPQRREQITDVEGNVLGTFWVTEFEQEEDGIVTRVRTWWAWSPGDQWQAPDSPRMLFAGEPVLYKLYLTERIPAGDKNGQAEEDRNGAKADGEIRRFARTYLPKLNQVIAEPTSAAGQTISRL